jgi:hypothetical protein
LFEHIGSALSIPRLLLFAFCYEGDNVPDAVMLSSGTVLLLLELDCALPFFLFLLSFFPLFLSLASHLYLFPFLDTAQPNKWTPPPSWTEMGFWGSNEHIVDLFE